MNALPLPTQLDREQHHAARTALAQAVHSGRQALLPVSGTSMLPSLLPGDLLVIQPASPAALQPGDLVVFDDGVQLIAHRLVGRRGPLLLTRGDNRRHLDSPFDPAALIGCVAAIIREGRTLAVNRRHSRLVGMLARAELWAIERGRAAGGLSSRPWAAGLRLLANRPLRALVRVLAPH